MFAVTVISTQGGVGKSTTCAHLGALLADAGLRVLMLDLDIQPTLSSYYKLTREASGGIYELIALNQTHPDPVISQTIIDRLHVILSNDFKGLGLIQAVAAVITPTKRPLPCAKHDS